MNRIVAIVVVWMIVAPGIVWADGHNVTELKSFTDKLCYKMGMDVGNYFKEIGEDINTATLLMGIEDAKAGKKPKLSEEELASLQKQVEEKIEVLRKELLEKMGAENKIAGAAFLEENKGRDGVTVTESGLQYEIVEPGNGEKPDVMDRVKVDYVGTLINGTEFDSTVKRGEPVVFGVNQVIPGWREALQLMDVGSKYRLVIPSELGYGENGAPPYIEPNSVLVFEVELLAIEK